MNTNNKVLLLVLLVMLVTVGITTGLGVGYQNRIATAGLQEHLESVNKVFTHKIEDSGQLAVALATALAEIPEVQQAFAERDRSKLTSMLYDSYLALDEQIGVPQCQFHLPPATSFLRLHQLDKFGDDLSNFRKTVLVTNREQRPTSGLEKGKAGYGIRGVVPVFNQGKYVGSFEMGMDFGLVFLQDIKDTLDADLSVYMYGKDSEVASFKEEQQGIFTPDFTLYISTRDEPLAVDEALRLQAFNSGKSIITDCIYRGVSYAVMVAPIYDFANDIVGVVEISVRCNDYLPQVATSSRNVYIAVSIGVYLILAILMWQLITRLIIRPR